MTCSGDNAPLSNEGFSLVASMGDETSMRKFLQRTINTKLGATLDGETGQLTLLSQRCFVDGIPRYTFEELMKLLEGAPWVKMGTPLTVGSRVLVKERYVATVQAVRAEGVEVLYNQNLLNPLRNPSRQMTEVVPKESMAVRPTMPSLNVVQMALVPEVVQEQAMRFRVILDQIRCSIVPIAQTVSAIVTWKPEKIRISRAIAWVCAIGSVVLFVFHEWYRMCGDSTIAKSPIQVWLQEKLQVKCGSHAQWMTYTRTLPVFHFLLVFVMDHGLSTFVLLGGTVVFFMQAGWLLPVKAAVRILTCRLTMKRTAPKKWAFFRKGLQGA